MTNEEIDKILGEYKNSLSDYKLYPIEKLEEINKQYKTEELIPGMLMIGSNGGGEALGIDMRKDSKTYQSLFRVSFIPLAWKEAVFLEK